MQQAGAARLKDLRKYRLVNISLPERFSQGETRLNHHVLKVNIHRRELHTAAWRMYPESGASKRWH